MAAALRSLRWQIASAMPAGSTLASYGAAGVGKGAFWPTAVLQQRSRSSSHTTSQEASRCVGAASTHTVGMVQSIEEGGSM